MKYTAKQIAELLGGFVEGNENTEINDVSKIEEGKPGTLSFLANPKYAEYLYTTKASAVIINKDFELKQPIETNLIRVNDAYQSFAALLDIYQQFKTTKTGISPKATVEDSATFGEEVYLGAHAYIGEKVSLGDGVKIYPNSYIGDGVSIGDNTIIHAGVNIYHDCVIGESCTIHAGTVVGSDGFGFAPQEGKEYKKIPQIGKVIIHGNVEIGANCTIDRATMGATVIGEGVKLDNLIQVGHNVVIGKHTVIASQTGISGSTKIGSYCMVGGQVGFSGHIEVADKVKIGAQSGLLKSEKNEGTVLQGSPAVPIKDFYKSQIIIQKLPEMYRELNSLKKSK
ncbi:MAG: UDP-3-O-(3-hydroxymyristoyl)glucosamine N-acyltransferase [Bacteroidota bacterium]|nr:UDP-3-O-(3-hydroxymyristoyl)glucosamine N-acyltransferase [Bacteroidota bacterium]